MGFRVKKISDSEASDRFMTKFGPVNALRLLGYAYKMEFYGEDWLRQNVSRQQLLFIRRQFEEADVPWGEGAIEWPRLVRGLKKAHVDAKARSKRAHDELEAIRARRSPRTA